MTNTLFQKLEKLKEEVFYLRNNKERLLSNLSASVEVRKIVERSVYLCAEIALDIADMVIIQKGLPKAATYSESIYRLGDYGITPKTFAHRFAYIAGLRNFLAHDYQLNANPALEKFLRSGLDDMEEFIGYIGKA